VKGDPIDEMMA